MCSFIQEVTPRAPTRLKTRGSRLGSLYYDNITTLAILPRRIRHDQPNESRQRPCGDVVFVGEVCLLKEQRHWPLQNQTRGSRLGSLL
jgi:hypothetical protein